MLVMKGGPEIVFLSRSVSLTVFHLQYHWLIHSCFRIRSSSHLNWIIAAETVVPDLSNKE